MNLDFHYFATFAAARLAGYTHAEAGIISYAAQFVDDCTSDFNTIEIRSGETFPLTQTFQGLGAMGKANLVWSENSLNEMMRIWTSFHFLPGNFKKDPDGRVVLINENTGLRSHGGMFSGWKYDEEAEEHFKCICMPHSVLALAMLSDTYAHYRENLYMIGVRMHVLADTWAHMYFAGIPSWFLNGSTSITARTPGVKINFDSAMQRTLATIGSLLGRCAPYYNSVCYLGHLHAQHYPDYPYLDFDIKPLWHSTYFLRKNSVAFFEAFENMYSFLHLLRNGTEAPPLSAGNSQVICEVLASREDDQSRTWENRIPMLLAADGSALAQPPEYKKNAWADLARKCLDQEAFYESHLGQFSAAAADQIAFVGSFLEEYDIHISNTPDTRIMSFTLHNGTGQWLQLAEQHLRADTNPGCTLQFIFPKAHGGVMRAGDTVKIKRTDATDKNYLGMWRYKKDTVTKTGFWKVPIEAIVTPFEIIRRQFDGSTDPYPRLYFEAKDWDPMRQKWVISQRTADGTGFSAEGDPIVFSRPVQIRNAFSLRYLQPDPETDYLTTGKTPYDWYLTRQ